VAKFFHQQIVSNSPSSRQLAALSLGILRVTSEINDLFGLLSDPVPEVRNSACLALGLFDQDDTKDIIVQALYQGDETIRRLAAELLAQIPGRGYSELKKAVTSDDILVRRAVVYGLSQINEPWSRDLLFNMQIQDGQWVVKNAAAHSLQTMDVSGHLPRTLPPPHISPWLVRIAGENGMGISPTRVPVDVFLNILANGKQEEQIGVLEYISHIQSEGMIAQVYDILYGVPSPIQQSAFYTLWRLALSGAPLPSTMKYGFK
jgi:hypothetical protein